MSSSSVDHRRLARPSLFDTRLSLGSLILASIICCFAAWICRFAPELWSDIGRISLLLAMLVGFALLVLVASLTFILACVGSAALFVLACHRTTQVVFGRS